MLVCAHEGYFRIFEESFRLAGVAPLSDDAGVVGDFGDGLLAPCLEAGLEVLFPACGQQVDLVPFAFRKSEGVSLADESGHGLFVPECERNPVHVEFLGEELGCVGVPVAEVGI